MSRAFSRQTAPSASSFPGDLMEFGFKLLELSIDNLRTITQTAPRSLPDLSGLRRTPSCAIPETECPPRCACETTWQASPGETVSTLVHVINASKTPRSFQVAATPFSGPNAPAKAIDVSPSAFGLQPEGRAVVAARYAVPDDLIEGDYYAEIVVRGAWERCVRVLLQVRHRKTCGDDRCACEVEVGDPPVRIRAHHWYHHFQCTEPCVDPRDRVSAPNNQAEGRGGPASS